MFKFLYGGGDLAFLRGVPNPILFQRIFYFGVKIGYTPNFTALGHLEVPWKFLVVVGGGGKHQ